MTEARTGGTDPSFSHGMNPLLAQLRETHRGEFSILPSALAWDLKLEQQEKAGMGALQMPTMKSMHPKSVTELSQGKQTRISTGEEQPALQRSLVLGTELCWK